MLCTHIEHLSRPVDTLESQIRRSTILGQFINAEGIRSAGVIDVLLRSSVQIRSISCLAGLDLILYCIMILIVVYL